MRRTASPWISTKTRFMAEYEWHHRWENIWPEVIENIRNQRIISEGSIYSVRGPS